MRIFLLVWFVLLSSVSGVFAQNWLDGDVKLEILPKSDAIGTTNQKILQEGTVWDNYNEIAENSDTADQIATGVMTWDTILDYGVYLLRFLSQAGIAIGGLMFVYTGYQYIMSVLWASSPDEKLIPNAITGILVIIFSYAIMRILTRMFLT